MRNFSVRIKKIKPKYLTITNSDGQGAKLLSEKFFVRYQIIINLRPIFKGTWFTRKQSLLDIEEEISLAWEEHNKNGF